MRNFLVIAKAFLLSIYVQAGTDQPYAFDKTKLIIDLTEKISEQKIGFSLLIQGNGYQEKPEKSKIYLNGVELQVKRLSNGGYNYYCETSLSETYKFEIVNLEKHPNVEINVKSLAFQINVPKTISKQSDLKIPFVGKLEKTDHSYVSYEPTTPQKKRWYTLISSFSGQEIVVSQKRLAELPAVSGILSAGIVRKWKTDNHKISHMFVNKSKVEVN
jgi:hypothetical protein